MIPEPSVSRRPWRPDSVLESLSGLRFGRFRLRLRVLSPMTLPAFTGNAFRGGFGYALRDACCLLPKPLPSCSDCGRKAECVYARNFEPKRPAETDLMDFFGDIPRPFVLDPPFGADLSFAPDERLELGLVLVGQALDDFEAYIQAFRLLGTRGVGQGYKDGFGRFGLEEVLMEHPDGGESPADPDGAWRIALPTLHEWVEPGLKLWGRRRRRLGVCLLTPTTLLHDGQPAISFRILMKAVLRRVSALAFFHCGVYPTIDYAELLRRAEEVRLVPVDLGWATTRRHSTRQERQVPMGGFLGSFVLEGDLEPFMPLLVLGGLLHAGKATVFGFGRYALFAP